MMLRSRASGTLDHAIATIASYSEGVTWREGSSGLILILTAGGYALTAGAEPSPPGASSSARVVITKEDGTPMGEGHRLTQRERERAVRALLQRTLDRRIAKN